MSTSTIKIWRAIHRLSKTNILLRGTPIDVTLFLRRSCMKDALVGEVSLEFDILNIKEISIQIEIY